VVCRQNGESHSASVFEASSFSRQKTQAFCWFYRVVIAAIAVWLLVVLALVAAVVGQFRAVVGGCGRLSNAMSGGRHKSQRRAAAAVH
jgi:hypothetical protein